MHADLTAPEIKRELSELRSICDQIRSKILMYNPQQLIGGLWSTMLMSLISRFDDEGNGSLPNVTADEKHVLFALEYLHATYAAEGLPDTTASKTVDDVILKELLELSEKAITQAFRLGFSSISEHLDNETTSLYQLQSTILTNWVLIRGRRYPVMEEEFLNYVLQPHDAIIRELYDISAPDLAKEIQAAAAAAREGIDRARDVIERLLQKTTDQADSAETSILAILEGGGNMTDEDREQLSSAYDDMMLGGIFNVSKQTSIPHDLLADLCYEAGSEDQFVDGSDFSGTPLQTLPARVRPLVKIDGDYFCTEPNFIRDSLYRALQRAIIARRPEYREDWNRRQKEMSEAAFAELMKSSLHTAKVFSDVYYPIGKKKWAETDGVILIDDVMICLEAKAGSESLAAPSSNMASHVNKIEELVIKAYRQAKRFIEYIYASDEAPLYTKGDDGTFVEVARVRKAELRKVYPIGLTVEAFSPYSAAVKERDDVIAAADQHNFISLSIDDLFVLRRLLSGAGEFLHYLDVRQALAGMKNVNLFDEMDHVGAYISNNRIDQRVRQMVEDEGADYITIDGMQEDILDPYFTHPEWPDCQPPTQKYPVRTQEVLDGLATTAQPGWLSGDSFIRDMSGEGRAQISNQYEKVLPNLAHKVSTYFAVGGEITAVFALIRDNVDPVTTDVIRIAETIAISLKQPNIRLFEISVRPTGNVVGVVSKSVTAPPAVRQDYAELLADAEKIRSKMFAL
ncbi:hypothetical protein SAMN04490244_10391 [Tranquillimonas rosea]|uniref:Nuclease-related domain-containing protein n=1 Tax=Tranquillimonas rosea TaxID=641238 RepID=A0A1H9S987_9RHOB|nr:NERD domain-containing protein [Tranquillimonas rosea]SER81562.1 hypothetical protein SAMN04490244_10391 [Tranquillimonas rosea]